MVKRKENLQFVKNRLLSMYARLAEGHLVCMPGLPRDIRFINRKKL